MVLPLELDLAIKIAHDQMIKDPHCSLLAKQRLPIYKAMENSEPVIGKKTKGWLAVLSAKKVLPIWGKEDPSDSYAKLRLQLAEKLILGSTSLEEINKDYPYLIGSLGMSLGENSWDYTFEATSAFYAQNLALAEVIGDFQYKIEINISSKVIKITEEQIEIGLPDEMPISYNIDTASAAVCAYSGISFDWDKINYLPYLELSNTEKVLDIVNTTFAPKFKSERRKQFWQWWLGEAIPEAWELAQQFSNYP